jgi:tryptophan 2-monooxygenase
MTHQDAPPDGLAEKWRYGFPNCADFNFNYSEALKRPLGTLPEGVSVAVIGAGVAGLVAARELLRSGASKIDIYEASSRIGGRLWSEPIASPYPAQTTMMEMGAMRMPMFGEVNRRNSVLAHYCDVFGLRSVPFPNPGSPGCSTGIYINGGRGADGSTRADIIARWTQNGTEAVPPVEYREIYRKWSVFKSAFHEVAKRKYGSERWIGFWKALASEYWDVSFRDFVRMAPVLNVGLHGVGKFGGLGMSKEEADIFYVIGCGDGGWGAFYEISSLYVIRTLLCGFDELKLVVGKDEPTSVDLLDNSDTPVPFTLNFRGVQSIAECLYFEPVEPGGESLASSSRVRLFLRSRASFVRKWGYNGRHEHELKFRPVDEHGVPSPEVPGDYSTVPHAEKSADVRYQGIVLTPTTWALQESLLSSGFDDDPSTSLRSVRKSLNVSHWISSCKVFFPLKERFWEVTGIPQTLVTDTFVRDMYGYAYGNDPGVLLASYTWEDDADKILAETATVEARREFGERCIRKLDHILRKASLLPSGKYESMRDFLADPVEARVFQWRLQPDYRGCAKLYRARSWDDDYALLSYNQEKSGSSGLYLAGEGYSVEGGWTEPALRMALDAVIHLVRNNGGHLMFPGEYYPKYDAGWSPDPSST